MSLHEDSVTTWLQQLKSGRTHAAEKIWHRYVEQLARLARRKLRGVRRAADEEDVVLSAFEGFLRGVDEGRFAKLNDRDDLWQVLVMLTERRAIALRRRELALKRGGGTVRGDSVFAHLDGNGSHMAGIEQYAVYEATPEFAIEVAEELRHRLDQLADDDLAQIAVGKLEGNTNQELAGQLKLSLRGVERKLGLIRDKWRTDLANE